MHDSFRRLAEWVLWAHIPARIKENEATFYIRSDPQVRR